MSEQLSHHHHLVVSGLLHELASGSTAPYFANDVGLSSASSLTSSVVPSVNEIASSRSVHGDQRRHRCRRFDSDKLTMQPLKVQPQQSTSSFRMPKLEMSKYHLEMMIVCCLDLATPRWANCPTSFYKLLGLVCSAKCENGMQKRLRKTPWPKRPNRLCVDS